MCGELQVSGRVEQQQTRSPQCVAKAGDLELLRHCVTRRKLCMQLWCDILVPTEAMLLSHCVAGSEIFTLAAVDRVSSVHSGRSIAVRLVLSNEYFLSIMLYHQ